MLHIGKVNTDENKKLAAQYQIQSFPTFVIFKNGNFLEHYKGPQSAAGFYHAVVSANHGEEQETDCKIINKMKKKDKSFTIVFFGPKDHPFYENIYLKMYEELKTDAS